MSDLDQYLTDDMIHVALRASDSANEGGVVGGRERMMRAALSAVLPDIIRQAKANALTGAASAYQWGGWADDPHVRGDLAVRRRQAEHAVKWLRDRVEREVF